MLDPAAAGDADIANLSMGGEDLKIAGEHKAFEEGRRQGFELGKRAGRDEVIEKLRDLLGVHECHHCEEALDA